MPISVWQFLSSGWHENKIHLVEAPSISRYQSPPDYSRYIIIILFWWVIQEVRVFLSSRLRNPALAFFLYLGFGNFVLPVLVFLCSGVFAILRSSVPGFNVSIPSGAAVVPKKAIWGVNTPSPGHLPPTINFLPWCSSRILVGRIVHARSKGWFVVLFSSDISLIQEAVSMKNRTKRNGRNKVTERSPQKSL